MPSTKFVTTYFFPFPVLQTISILPHLSKSINGATFKTKAKSHNDQSQKNSSTVKTEPKCVINMLSVTSEMCTKRFPRADLTSLLNYHEILMYKPRARFLLTAKHLCFADRRMKLHQ
ncbi:hypothetical protein CEXT_755391 [Caerostris extrusa]|uniref:Uncharacterized protein n=1 Tax=Caerostris extrusa TaxID=172846 RepID=A0AAV4PW30_CAEEX|nr:hypothetical protein CEXT_755391 [Caerostris extrusa]